MIESRLKALTALVEFSHSPDVLGLRISEFDWDYDGVPVELTRAHLVDVLRRYIDRKLLAGDVEHWANLIEGREDICFEHDSEEQVDEALHRLANPGLTYPLSEFSANEIIENLLK